MNEQEKIASLYELFTILGKSLEINDWCYWRDEALQSCMGTFVLDECALTVNGDTVCRCKEMNLYRDEITNITEELRYQKFICPKWIIYMDMWEGSGTHDWNFQWKIRGFSERRPAMKKIIQYLYDYGADVTVLLNGVIIPYTTCIKYKNKIVPCEVEDWLAFFLEEDKNWRPYIKFKHR